MKSVSVHRIETPLGDRRCDLYLFTGPARAVLYDAGVAGTVPAYVLPYLAEHGLDARSVEHVVVSHCDVDHFGGIGDVREHLPAARVVAHSADAPLMADFGAYVTGRGEPFAATHGVHEGEAGLAWQREVTHEAAVDLAVSGGESIDLGDHAVTLLHLPGHTWGHLAVWDESSGSLAIADAILGSAVPLADGAPAFPPTYRHVAPYLATIARVRELAPVRLLTAHYGVFEGAAVTAFLDESERFVLELDKQVRASLRRAGEAGTTLVRLLDDLTGRIGAWPSEGVASAFAFPVAGHVEWLAERGDAVVDLATTPPTFRARP